MIPKLSALIVMLPPPVELTMFLTLVVVLSGSILLEVKFMLTAEEVSSVTVQFSFPFPGSSLTAFTVTNKVSLTHLAGSGSPESHTV